MPKYILLSLLIIIISYLPANGQIYEVGASVGMSAYRGDLNLNKIFNKTHSAGGLILRYSHNEHIGARLNLGYTLLRGSDSRSDNPYIIFPNTASSPPSAPPVRQFSFETTVLEASLQIEVNFLPFTAGDPETRFTPYIFGGGGGIYFNPDIYRDKQPYEGDDHLIIPTTGDLEDTGRNFAAIGLAGFGFKLNVVRDIVVDASWGFRFSDTDYLDEVSLRGNPKDNDYYSIISLTVTYKFLDRSRPPCPMHRF